MQVVSLQESSVHVVAIVTQLRAAKYPPPVFRTVRLILVVDAVDAVDKELTDLHDMNKLCQLLFLVYKHDTHRVTCGVFE